MSDAASGEFHWKDGDWSHILTPKGHRWQWSASNGQTVHDFGLITGGQFVAITSAVRLSGLPFYEVEG